MSGIVMLAHRRRAAPGRLAQEVGAEFAASVPVRQVPPFPSRRAAIALAIGALSGVHALAEARHPRPIWYEAALEMRKLAESWGDQSYGAVLVKHDKVIGDGPSRVIKDNNSDAHAERVAIQDAIARAGAKQVRGAVLYSTSRPCRACERAAAKAGVARMYFGPALSDAGIPDGT